MRVNIRGRRWPSASKLSLSIGAGLAAMAVVAACGSSGPAGSAASSGQGGVATKYDAKVRRTSYGIPHIQAAEFGSLGYGIGYVQAQDNLCTLADDFTTIRGERSRYFGPTGTYSIPANGSDANNVDSDFFWKFSATDDRVAALKKESMPETAVATQGFVDGYNRYVAELRAGAHPGENAACATSGYVHPLVLDDVYRRYYRLSVLASSSVFPTEIANAAPPSAGSASAAATPAQILAKVKRSDLPFAKPLKIGSNMYGIGSADSKNGQSLLFGNPHFPWVGTERLYAMHLTVPGREDIFGSSLYGVPAILIGFNQNLAWSHTVSTAYRFTFFELTLDPSNPTSYLVDNVSTPMTAVPLSIDVLQSDGSLKTQTRTLYKTIYGPMVTVSASGVTVLGWTNTKAYTLRDANAENTRLINQFFAWNQAQTLTEFEALHASILGVPWVNTVATGPGQHVYYGDITVVPNVSNAKVQACPSSVSTVFAQLVPGLPVLDGSKSSCNWDTDADAPAPGIFGPSHLPTLRRNDFVANNNDSYWLTNPAQPLTGFARIIGDEATARTLRTRLSILQVQRRMAGTDGLAGTGFDIPTLEQTVLSSHLYSAELGVGPVESTICPQGTVVGSSGPVNVGPACAVIAKWDQASNLDSKGAHLWREFWTRADSATGFYTTAFSASDPVNTPSGVNAASPQVQQALGDAVTLLNTDGIALDAPLGSLQYSAIQPGRIPIFGDLGDSTGSFTVAASDGLTKDGYAINFGNSYIQAVTWNADGTPDAHGFVTYSESTDAGSPHFADLTHQYSGKNWVLYPFTDAQINADPQLLSFELKE